MNPFHSKASIFLLLLSLSGGAVFAEDSKPTKPTTKAVCSLTGKATNAEFSATYEDKAYAFCSADCVAKFKEQRRASLYEKIGGKAALSAAIDLFYQKLLADERVNHFFEDVNMRRQHNRQKAFIGAALGSPEPWTGKDLRKVHASLDLTETDFGIVAGHLQTTLEELKVDKELIGQVMTIVGSTKDAVLNKKENKANPATE